VNKKNKSYNSTPYLTVAQGFIIFVFDLPDKIQDKKYLQIWQSQKKYLQLTPTAFKRRIKSHAAKLTSKRCSSCIDLLQDKVPTDGRKKCSNGGIHTITII